MIAGPSGSIPHLDHLQQQPSARQEQQPKGTLAPLPTPPSVDRHHVKPPTGLKRGFLSGKASSSNSKTSQQAVIASSASQSTSRAGQGTSGADQCKHGAVESQLQQDNSNRSTLPAFSGSVLERSASSKGIAALDEPPVHAQKRSSGLPNTSTAGLGAASSLGQGANQALPRKVSKFKQSRNAK